MPLFTRLQRYCETWHSSQETDFGFFAYILCKKLKTKRLKGDLITVYYWSLHCGDQRQAPGEWSAVVSGEVWAGS